MNSKSTTTITEIHDTDIITSPATYMIAHCISRDCALGVGIAKYLDDVYDIKRALINASFNASSDLVSIVESPITGRLIANIVTKHKYYHKPTYESLQLALNALLSTMIDKRITKLALPKIGCGYDKLEWSRVKSMIYDTFSHVDGFDILLYV